MTSSKVCSGTVPMVLAARPAKQNPEYFLIGAIQSTNPQFWGATYVPYETANRLYANAMLRPSFYDEGCFSTQCDLQTMNTCTRLANVESIVKPNWNPAMDVLYKSDDKFATSAVARQWSVLHNQLAASTSVPMGGMGTPSLATAAIPGPIAVSAKDLPVPVVSSLAASGYVPLYPSLNSTIQSSVASQQSYAITF